MADAPFIVIHDEWKVIHSLLRDPVFNYGLNTIVHMTEPPDPGGDEADRDSNLLRHSNDYDDYPHIIINIIGDSAVFSGEPGEDPGTLEDRYTLRVRIDVKIERDQVLTYGGIPYQGTPTTLNVIRKVIQRTLTKVDGFVPDFDSDICIVDTARRGTVILEGIEGDNIDEVRIWFDIVMQETHQYTPLG